MPADQVLPADPTALDGFALEELILAGRHLEDLEIFAGQRSRMNPEPGWDPVLRLLARDLEVVRLALARLGHHRPLGRSARA